MARRRRTPQEKKALAYAKDTRGHYTDSPNIKFSRKLNPLRNAQENRRRRRVFNARTQSLALMDDDAADIEVIYGDLEQDLGRLGKRIPSTYGPWPLGEHVAMQTKERERRRRNNLLWQWVTCPKCGRRYKAYRGDDPAVQEKLGPPPEA
ncbi:MAG: hypothetical protein AAGJ94_09675 [Pseudomonadota bacterium]